MPDLQLRRLIPAVPVVLSAIMHGESSLADAIVRSQAMFASTIAEIYVEEDQVGLELEIGLDNLDAFRSLLPDGIHEQMEFGDTPLAERLKRFLENEFVLFADGEVLRGSLKSIGPSERIRRDEITGEPLPVEDDPETVIDAQFFWPLQTPPEQLEIRLQLPSAASVGYVVYHQGVAVNDFRYLTASQTVNLDWSDPWYSAFTSRSLRRQYYAPMSGFIYVEPYEVRKEIIIRPKDLQRYVEIGLGDRETIPVEMQPDIKQKAIEFLRGHQPITIDGSPAEPVAVRADFLERSLRTSRVIDPPEELNINSAILGVKFIYSHPDFADSVTMRWDLFDEKIQIVPVSAVDPTGPLPQFLEPDYDLLEWQNFIRIPVMPELAQVNTPPPAAAQWMFYGRWLLVGLALWMLTRFTSALRNSEGKTRAAGALAACSLAVAAAGWWFGSQAQLNPEATRNVVAGVLTNVYRAFDFREEGEIYDVLQQSVDGELLRDVYLEMRRGLVLASQGGASAKVKGMELMELETEPADDRGFSARATWQVRAAVGHWGHIHERRNEYQADLLFRPVEGTWKLVDVEILDEVRL